MSPRDDTEVVEFEPLTRQEIVWLWPTSVMKQVLPGSDQVNASLAELAQTDSTYGEINRDHETGKWLYAQIEHGACQYFYRAGLNRDGRIRISAHFEVHGFVGYRSLVYEPCGMLTGRYGVTLPTDVVPGPSRDDLHPGYISFYDPRSAMNMSAIRRDPYLNYHRSIELKPGMLLMWPSYLSFFIHPNLSRTPRISVAFNIYKEDGAE